MRDLTEHFEVELNSVKGGFTLIPIEDSEGQLSIRDDGVIWDGDLHLWEEIKEFRITRKELWKIKRRRKRNTQTASSVWLKPNIINIARIRG